MQVLQCSSDSLTENPPADYCAAGVVRGKVQRGTARHDPHAARERGLGPTAVAVGEGPDSQQAPTHHPLSCQFPGTD